MLSLKEWIALVDYRITDGSTFWCEAFGNNAYSLDAWSGEQDGYSFSVVFDTKDQTVYEVQACDFKNNRAYRIINPAYRPRFIRELAARGVSDVAWDEVKWTDLEVDDDFIQKAQAIKAGEDYDTNISVPVNFTDDELLKYMTMAHERDITFNQFVEEALQCAIDEHNRDPADWARRAQTFTQTADYWSEP